MKIVNSGREMSSSEKTLITILACISAVFLYWILLIQPTLKAMEPDKKEVNSLKAQVQKIDTIQSDIKSKEDELKSLQDKYDEATKVIPKGDKYPELLRSIREMAESNSIKITKYTLTEPKAYSKSGESAENATTNSLNMYTINIEVTGDYTNVLSYINKIEEDVRIVNISKVESKIEKENLVTKIQLDYFVTGTIDEEKYDFNTGSYGKDNPFN